MEDQKFPNKIGTRPTALNRLMIAPIVLAFGLAMVTGVLIWKMTEERTATGARVSLQLKGECLSSAQDVIIRRAKAVGVGEPVLTKNDDGMLFTLTLPSIPDAQTQIPRLLTRPGVWTMKDGDKILLTSEDVSQAVFSLDESGMPETLLTFDPAAKQQAQQYLDQYPEGRTELWLDDDKIIERPNSIPIADDFRLVSTNTEPSVRMKEAADFGILFSNPAIRCQIDWVNLADEL